MSQKIIILFILCIPFLRSFTQEIDFYRRVSDPRAIARLDNADSKSIRIVISLFDIEGKEVLKLYDEYLLQNQYSFDADAGSISKGGYLYAAKIYGTNGVETITRRLVLE